jgi:3,4-dihydroxy 2-butanone 4-phosphate synthase/GTP cyclohydrolase II
VLCELVNDDGSMARGQSLETFADLYGLVMISIDDLVAYRWRTEALVTREASAVLPTQYGAFEIVGYRSMTDDSQHVALVMGEVTGKVDVLSRGMCSDPCDVTAAPNSRSRCARLRRKVWV